MFIRFALTCVLSTLAFAQGAKIEFNPVERATVEARLKQAAQKNPERELTLKGLFEEAGCRGDRLIEQPVKRSQQPNIICTLPGEGGGTIVIGGHFDFSGSGEGVVDNWSGAALLPSLYEALAGQARRHTLVFVGFTDEERGLTGSNYYVHELSQEQIAQVRAMVNLDSLGLSATKIWLSASDKKLAGMLAAVAASMKLPLTGLNIGAVGTTDSTSFAKKKIPVVALHSVTQETLSVLHSAKDSIAAVRMDDYYETYRLVAAYLAFLDLKLE
jgi:Zn-dependent M28 family amino/carboxypeptidase